MFDQLQIKPSKSSLSSMILYASFSKICSVSLPTSKGNAVNLLKNLRDFLSVYFASENAVFSLMA